MTLLASYVARNPEDFSAEQALTLINFHRNGKGRPVDVWPYSLLLAQYPALANSDQLKDHMADTFAARTCVAPLVAGTVIWNYDWPLVRNILDLLPEFIRIQISEIGTSLSAFRGSVDKRRLVLVAAELFLTLLEGADLVSIWRDLGMPVHVVHRNSVDDEQ